RCPRARAQPRASPPRNRRRSPRSPRRPAGSRSARCRHRARPPARPTRARARGRRRRPRRRSPTTGRRASRSCRRRTSRYLARSMADWQEYEEEAAQATASAPGSPELEEVRIAYLGRKAPLALALREVRDRETGMLLNGIRTRLEETVAARE